MIWVRVLLASGLAGLIANGTAGAPPRAAAIGRVQFSESVWTVGRVPTLDFTVAAGRGPTEKVRALLHVSEDPNPVLADLDPQIVGDLVPPTTVQVIVDLAPQRSQITPFTRERFVQGSLVDTQTGALIAVTNTVYLDVAYDAEPDTFKLDFETEDDAATPLVNGQDLSTPPEFGVLLSVSALQPVSGPHHFGPAVFDSTPGGPNQQSQDPDLLVGRGNVLILQGTSGQSSAGFFTHPNDSANGGTIVFDFTGFDVIEKVEPVSIDLVDIDLASPRPTTVVLEDVLGNTRTYTVPAGWTRDITQHFGGPGVGTLDLTTLDPQQGYQATATASQSADFIPGEVVRLEVALGGSGAIDTLVFRREADPDALVIDRNKIRVR